MPAGGPQSAWTTTKNAAVPAIAANVRAHPSFKCSSIRARAVDSPSMRIRGEFDRELDRVDSAFSWSALVTAGAVIAVDRRHRPRRAASRSSDQQTAKAGVLVRSDFPSGWSQAKRDDSSDASVATGRREDPRVHAVREVLARPTSRTRAPKSPEFTLGQSSVDNTANVFPSVKAATAAMTTFGSSALPACLDKLFTSVFNAQFAADPKTAEQITGLGVKINRLRGIKIGDKAVAYEGVVDVNLTDGSTETIGLGYIAIQVGHGGFRVHLLVRQRHLFRAAAGDRVVGGPPEEGRRYLVVATGSHAGHPHLALARTARDR